MSITQRLLSLAAGHPVCAAALACGALSAPLSAQVGAKDLLLSAPGAGAIWHVDAATDLGSPLATPMSIPHYGWVAPDGNFYVPDRGYEAIMKITPGGELSVLTSGGLLQMPVTCVPSPDGKALVVSDMLSNAIVRVGFDGSQTLMHDAASTGGLLSGPDGMAYDDAGNLYVANLGSSTIVRIDAQGTASLFSDSPIVSWPGGVAIDGAGNLFVANYAAHTIARFRLDTGVGEVFAETFSVVHYPNDLKLSRSGGLLVCGRPGAVGRVDALGHITEVFSDPSLGELDGVSVPEDATLCSGRFDVYGAGEPGTGGLVPQFQGIFSPCAGQTIGLDFAGFAGGAPAVMFVGSQALPEGAVKFKGASLLVDPAGALFLPISLTLPADGKLRLQFQVPMIAGLVGLQLFHQVFAADAGAAHGVSASNGLKETFGS
jgi:sugar lactone lactonase YvrE